MPAYILTGAPGAGKTAVLRLLETDGYAVVEETATDVIALGNALGREEPWRDHAFIDHVITLQRQRQDAALASESAAVVFFDRSPVCTLALSRHLGVAPSPCSPVRSAGSCRRAHTSGRSSSFATRASSGYRDLGFQLVDVPPGPLAERVALVRQTVEHLRRSLSWPDADEP